MSINNNLDWINITAGYTSDTYRIHIGYISALSDKCIISIQYFLKIYRIPNKLMVCNWYFTTRYVCNMCMISVICITEFTHKQHTYWVPDMCVITKYHTHILHISYTYLVPDMYPITLILTCEGSIIVYSRVILIRWLGGWNPRPHDKHA